MPIYAYRCDACGHAKDVLQKISEAVLTTCPSCGADTFKKQVTAAGFQLKGSGWYATDFRGGNKGNGAAKPDGAAETKTEGGKSEPAPAAATPSTDSSTAGGSAPAGGCGTSCACH